jgi:hypothetical protein
MGVKKRKRAMLISNPLQMLQKSWEKSYERKSERIMEFFIFLLFSVKTLYYDSDPEPVALRFYTTKTGACEGAGQLFVNCHAAFT